MKGIDKLSERLQLEGIDELNKRVEEINKLKKQLQEIPPDNIDDYNSIYDKLVAAKSVLKHWIARRETEIVTKIHKLYEKIDQDIEFTEDDKNFFGYFIYEKTKGWRKYDRQKLFIDYIAKLILNTDLPEKRKKLSEVKNTWLFYDYLEDIFRVPRTIKEKIISDMAVKLNKDVNTISKTLRRGALIEDREDVATAKYLTTIKHLASEERAQAEQEFRRKWKELVPSMS